MQNMAAADKAGFTERYRALLDSLNAKRKAHEAFDFPAEVAAYEQQHGIEEPPVFAVRVLKQYRGQIMWPVLLLQSGSYPSSRRGASAPWPEVKRGSVALLMFRPRWQHRRRQAV